jgi:hypothetical protein
MHWIFGMSYGRLKHSNSSKTCVVAFEWYWG